ncbi:gas vesicle protein [Micromonospora globispora]|uniref:Gas vesicle protein A n=1 Tax=Micromonospora globispora TaxID=1450148 RepID=A0A317K1B7_9ACTN|nr:gas vesicle protein [Micromonospora globispora]PWU61933.1 gas vesicle protein [Micromonospora globispora]RQW84503.1 gas vesicle protein [Micromonospora globispora]
MAPTSGGPTGALERGGASSGTLADVVETVLDKGVVIDAQVSVAVVGIQLLEINARIVIASVETYLRFAEAVDRLSIVPEDQKGLPDLIEGATGAVSKGKAMSGLGKAAKEISGAVVDSLSDRGSERERGRPRRRRDEEG